MLKKIVVSLTLGGSFLYAGAQVQWPQVTNTMKPWTRWWWEGSAVNAKDLTWNLEQYRAAGLGGVEITPIYGIKGAEKQFIPFLSAQWMEVIQHTLSESKRLGLGVDLANATGWPFGGPWTKDADASKAVYFKNYEVKGGERLAEAVAYKQDAWVRTANGKPAGVDSIKKDIGSNGNLQDLALDQVIFAGNLPLQKLMAYSDKGEKLDLTNRVDANGQLNWTAPQTASKWTLYALFMGLHGKMVERAAPGGEGYAIDHFSKTAADNYFKPFDKVLKGRDISYLRAFFNDSYEVDDARGQANWTPLLFQEFFRLKGYRLEEYLPELFGKGNGEKNRRVLYDYRSVIDELILHHFTETWQKWGRKHGAMVRNQSHGSPANTLDLYSAVDIPETEGTDVLRFKFASSASHVTGKPLTAAESATWLNEHFLSSWGDVKKIIDLYFLGGVNHIVYHGTAYSPKDVAWPGWLFYAAVHFQPTNPQWKDFHALNQYITRVQSFLQAGKPDNDVLLYYPIVDRYSEPGRDLLQHFDGMERNFENSNFEHVSKWMLEEGYHFDFFSERQLQGVQSAGNKLQTGGNSYSVILLPANKLISETAMAKLVSLARAGAKVLVHRAMPSDVPGLSKLEQRQKAFQDLVGQLKFNTNGKVQQATIGKGSFTVSDDLDALFASAGVRREHLPEGLHFERRKNTTGYTYFINNRSEKEIDQWVKLSAPAASVLLFEPMTGAAGLAQWRKSGNGQLEVHLQLKPHNSIIVQTGNTVKKGKSFPYTKTTGEAQPINGPWKLAFTSGGPVLPAAVTVNQLGSWTELQGEEVKNFSGTASYTTTFARPSGNATALQLDLGKVNETAEVLLNGKRIATLVGPVFTTVIPATLLKDQNELTVIVSNLMANRISYMDRNNLPWKIFYNINMPARKKENAKNGLFDASSWKPLPSGLSGPVTLTPLNYE